MKFLAGLAIGILLGVFVHDWLIPPMALPLAQPQILLQTRPAPDDGNRSASKNPVRSPEHMAVMSGHGRTSVVLLYVENGWFALQAIDGGMVTGEVIRFHPGMRIGLMGTRPAGWTIGGK